MVRVSYESNEFVLEKFALNAHKNFIEFSNKYNNLAIAVFEYAVNNDNDELMQMIQDDIDYIKAIAGGL